MAMNKVFVYGTLKEGEPNHVWLQDSSKGYSRFICRAETVEKYPLIIASRYNIPFLLDVPGTGHNVVGEVYEVDDPMLRNLDILENHPHFYNRDKREVQSEHFCDLGNKIYAWTYLIQEFRTELLDEPYQKEYSSQGDHGKLYTGRDKRDPSYSAQNDVKGTE